MRALLGRCALLVVALGVVTRPASAQQSTAPVRVGSIEEDYLRSLQVAGIAPLGQWTIRGFSTVELDRLRTTAAHPWSSRAELRASSTDTSRALQWAIVPLQLDGWYNTSYPFGLNDGAVWRGKGLTASMQGGASARWRWFSATLDPQVVWTENAFFRMMPQWSPTASEFADPLLPDNVDLPQRFGPGSFAKVYPGQSTLRADALGLTAGVSTANQWWGPMSDFPYVMGNNAPGYVHAFAGSSSPWNVWIGRIHGRVSYGRLEQSAYTSMPADSARRLASAIVGSFSPRGAPGLEIGFTRFFHTGWPEGGLTMDDLLLPVRALAKEKRRIEGDTTEVGAGGDPQNQLASVFFRWAFPRGGVEVYGEYGKEDHNINNEDLLQEPDHAATYGLGVRKSGVVAGRLLAARAELINYQRSTLQHHRAQGGIYLHAQWRQGHTHLGQLLGSGIAAQSGAGARVSFDSFGEHRSWGASWMRLAGLEQQGSLDRRPRLTVQHSLGAKYRQEYRGLELGAGVTGIYEFNRHFRGDAPSLELSGSVRWAGR